MTLEAGSARKDSGACIVAFGGYVPSLRISREEIVASNKWSNPSLVSSQTERSACGWDEDALTMGVEAARDCLSGLDRAAVDGIFFGTTTAPFADRLNSGIIASALGLREEIPAYDLGGSLRAGTTALRAAVECVIAYGGQVLCVASEKRASPATTIQELMTGHGAAALIMGRGQGLARLISTSSLTVDFIDHYRGTGREFDYSWEDRWVRDEGYLKIVPRLVADALAKGGVEPEEIDHFCLPSRVPGMGRLVAAHCRLTSAAVSEDLLNTCGDTGAAFPLMLLVSALEQAKPGEKILVVGFAGGGDALIFEVCDAAMRRRPSQAGVRKWLNRRLPSSYHRYLILNDMVKVDRGLRAEVDRQTQLTALYRHRDLVMALVGGRCSVCGTEQLPRTRICVNPACGSIDTQLPHRFAESPGKVISWSADSLTYTPDPPAYYGTIEFSGGARLMMDFTDVGNSVIDVGSGMHMMFRVKDYDSLRGFTRYFWKAVPVWPAEEG